MKIAMINWKKGTYTCKHPHTHVHVYIYKHALTMRTSIESEREVKTWHLSTKILIVKKGKKENCWILRKIQAQSRTTTTKKALHSASNEQRNMWKPVFMCHFKCILYTILVPSVDRIEVGIPPSKKEGRQYFSLRKTSWRMKKNTLPNIVHTISSFVELFTLYFDFAFV